jgi:hypothetical protein
MNDEHIDSYLSFSIIRMLQWTEHVAMMGDKRNAYRILAKKPLRKRLLGRPRKKMQIYLNVHHTEMRHEITASESSLPYLDATT